LIEGLVVSDKEISATELKSWICLLCGWIYEEAAGLPDEGIAPGTRWEDVPLNWICPECSAGKEDFEMVEF
jgi:rubredoxin